MIRQGYWEDEDGFTLIELLLTIAIMSFVFSIVAFSSWGGWMEGPRVDSATNQLAADLRQAHSRAINRLAPQTVTLTGGQSEYTVTGVAGTLDLDEDSDEDDVVVVGPAAPPVSVVFNGNGSATLPGGASTLTLTVSSAGGGASHDIEINGATSRVEVVLYP